MNFPYLQCFNNKLGMSAITIKDKIKCLRPKDEFKRTIVIDINTLAILWVWCLDKNITTLQPIILFVFLGMSQNLNLLRKTRYKKTIKFYVLIMLSLYKDTTFAIPIVCLHLAVKSLRSFVKASIILLIT